MGNNDYFDDGDYLPEIDLNPVRHERESKSKAAHCKDGGKSITVGNLTNPPDFLKTLIPKWTELAKNTDEPDWYVKLASTMFKHKETWYCIYPSDLDCSQGVFERISDRVAEDLLALGIVHVHYTGMLD